mmetsp:Transcript_18987/g.48585  ORF Transcript_18987/g.48585 Transcript_18987/m.48585 type:complete len:319 (-) Transcript_18987:402-1358(-)
MPMDATPFLLEPTSQELTRVAGRWKLIASISASAAFVLGLVAATVMNDLWSLQLTHRATLEQTERDMLELRSAATTAECKPHPPPPGMPMLPPQRSFPPSPPLPTFAPTDDVRDVAIIVFTRHGERTPDKDLVDLTPEGFTRAAYMSKCIARQPSVAFPFGAPTRLLASLRADSKRPVETLTPTAEKLHLDIETADMMDIYAVNKLLPTLKPGDQLLVSWQHWFIPKMIAALYPPTPHWLNSFPKACNTSEWVEPAYTRGGSDGDCYDIMWQLVLTRPRGAVDAPWQTVTLNLMHEGFAGTANSACAEALAPISRTIP